MSVKTPENHPEESFLFKKRKGSTLFVTAPLLFAMIFFLSFWIYDVFSEVEASFELTPGIETEIDEGCYGEYYCWFAFSF
jgi:hypothetical protein